MGFFLCIGFHRETGARRRRKFCANTVDDAINLASEEAIVVAEVKELPPPSSDEWNVSHFFTKVVGVTHDNRDGSSRQLIIPEVAPFEQLDLKHEDDNPVDPNAVAVHRPNQQQVGYLDRFLAHEVVDKSRRGYRYGVFAVGVTGRKTLGLNVVIFVCTPGTPDSAVQEYVNATVRDPTFNRRLRGAENMETD